MVFSVAFDLDSTLGYFESIHPYLMVFFPDLLQYVYKAPHYTGRPFPKLSIIHDDKKRLAKAFDNFVLFMARKEHINKLLRPGILDIIKLLLAAKQKGIVGGIMIYSSNSNPYMLLFASKLIQILLGLKEEIFCPLVHWWHPLRDEEVRKPGTLLHLGHGPKTVDTIINALMSRECRASTTGKIIPKNILFFDDIIHQDIYDNIPSANYFHVERYIHYGNQHVIYSCFLYSLMKNNIDIDKNLLKEFNKIGLYIGPDNSNIASFTNRVPTGTNRDIGDTDTILRRLNLLLDITMSRPIKRNNSTKSTIISVGGKRKTRKKTRMVYKILACLD